MRILIPVDGSEHSLRSVEFLTTRTDLLGENPHIDIFFSQPSIPKHIYLGETAEELKVYYDNEANAVFGAVSALLQGTNVKPEMTYSVGQAPLDIANEAERVNADLIIMGTRGEGPVRGLLFGSVSNAVVARVHRPILILRNKLPEGTKGLCVGIAADGSDFSFAAVDYVLKNLKLFGEGARFELINAGLSSHPIGFSSMAGMMVSASTDEEMLRYREKCFKEAVEPLLPKFREAGIEPKLVSLEGEPGPTIADYANNEPLDLLVMGSHGYGNFRAAVLGSVAMRIASQSSVPLLIIRK